MDISVMPEPIATNTNVAGVINIGTTGGGRLHSEGASTARAYGRRLREESKMEGTN